MSGSCLSTRLRCIKVIPSRQPTLADENYSLINHYTPAHKNETVDLKNLWRNFNVSCGTFYNSIDYKIDKLHEIVLRISSPTRNVPSGKGEMADDTFFQPPSKIRLWKTISISRCWRVGKNKFHLFVRSIDGSHSQVYRKNKLSLTPEWLNFFLHLKIESFANEYGFSSLQFQLTPVTVNLWSYGRIYQEPWPAIFSTLCHFAK